MRAKTPVPPPVVPIIPPQETLADTEPTATGATEQVGGKVLARRRGLSGLRIKTPATKK